jgi:hypothetical protein
VAELKIGMMVFLPRYATYRMLRTTGNHLGKTKILLIELNKLGLSCAKLRSS